MFIGIAVALISKTETRLGYPDIKTKPAYFYMQFQSKKVVLNEGEALSSSGEFTAPAEGTYHFAFSGVKSSSATGTASLQVNGATVGSAQANMGGNEVTMSLHSTITLKQNDKVTLTGSALKADGEYNCWSGWLLEENVLPATVSSSTSGGNPTTTAAAATVSRSH